MAMKGHEHLGEEDVSCPMLEMNSHLDHVASHTHYVSQSFIFLTMSRSVISQVLCPPTWLSK